MALGPRERQAKLSILQMDRGAPQHGSRWCPERERSKLLTLKARESQPCSCRAFNLDEDVFIHQANHPLTVLSSVVMGSNDHTLAEGDKRPCFRLFHFNIASLALQRLCYLEHVSSRVSVSWISALLPAGAMKHQLLCYLMDLIMLFLCMSLKATNMQHCKCSIATWDWPLNWTGKPMCIDRVDVNCLKSLP
uniref:Uncharacterized protein n=1 Tax=Rhinopithecus bieti TaxID=61621 RepID=A0A2K6M7I1_RHIBE